MLFYTTSLLKDVVLHNKLVERCCFTQQACSLYKIHDYFDNMHLFAYIYHCFLISSGSNHLFNCCNLFFQWIDISIHFYIHFCVILSHHDGVFHVGFQDLVLAEYVILIYCYFGILYIYICH